MISPSSLDVKLMPNIGLEPYFSLFVLKLNKNIAFNLITEQKLAFII